MNGLNNESICRNCDNNIDDLAKALLHGCPLCKHRKFKFIKRSKKDVKSLEKSLHKLFENSSEEVTVGVGIQILDKGVFKLDLKTLTANDDSLDPVIVQDKKGVINIIMESD